MKFPKLLLLLGALAGTRLLAAPVGAPVAAPPAVSAPPVIAPETGMRGAAPELKPRSFTNPLLGGGADPWVIRQGGYYYYCGSGAGGLFVSKSRELPEIGANRRIVFSPPEGQPYSRELWAPELHFFDGKWFIYVAADDGRNENHRMYVLRSKTGDAQGEYEMMGALDTGDRWAIDGNVFSWRGQLYFVWSGWEGTENVAQNLYIALDHRWPARPHFQTRTALGTEWAPPHQRRPHRPDTPQPPFHRLLGQRVLDRRLLPGSPRLSRRRYIGPQKLEEIPPGRLRQHR
jgi:hypothetical protein